MTMRTWTISGLFFGLLIGVVVQAEGLKPPIPRTRYKSYNVADLLVRADGEPETQVDRDMTSVIQLITSAVAPDSWPGPGASSGEKPLGSITPNPKDMSLIVRQTDEVHKDIQHLLSSIRQLPALQGTKKK
jgi:hypothetical protein